MKTGKYVHSKTGNLYWVNGYVFDVHDKILKVEYIPLYECEYPKFTRSFESFCEWVILEDREDYKFKPLKINLSVGNTCKVIAPINNQLVGDIIVLAEITPDGLYIIENCQGKYKPFHPGALDRL